MTDKIAEVFGVEPKEVLVLPRISNQVPATMDDLTKQMVENRKRDYVSARDNILNLLQDMGQVVAGAVEQVLTTPSARMIEVFGSLAKTYADINKDLIALTEVPASGKTPSETDPQTSPVNNVIFVGTSDSLIDQIRKNLK